MANPNNLVDLSDGTTVSQKSRTSSSSSHLSRSERSERKIKSSDSSNFSEDKKSSKSVSVKKEKKEVLGKKTSVKTETNGYSNHNGIESSVSLKNSINSEHGKLNYEDKSDGLASVTDLKSSFTKTSEESQQISFQEEVKSSVDRVKVQRTFSQSGQDDICLCKICGKHVYQMEKMKAEKNVFHKNCFRCAECNKLLTVDSYSSNEGDIYCKPHFRQLFQPKARFDGEDGAPRKQRRNEMIIRENVPAELPPDVIRYSDFPANRDDGATLGDMLIMIDQVQLPGKHSNRNALVCQPWKQSVCN